MPDFQLDFMNNRTGRRLCRMEFNARCWDEARAFARERHGKQRIILWCGTHMVMRLEPSEQAL